MYVQAGAVLEWKTSTEHLRIERDDFDDSVGATPSSEILLC